VLETPAFGWRQSADNRRRLTMTDIAPEVKRGRPSA